MLGPFVWHSWIRDPIAARTGVSFDRSPATNICAPTSMIRVCAYHIDFDERPTCYLDVATLAEAEWICANLSKAGCTFNVDYAVAYDEHGARVSATQW